MFKEISYLELWQPFCSESRTICAILVEGIIRNISVKYFAIGPVVQEEMLFKDNLVALLFGRAEQNVQLC